MKFEEVLSNLAQPSNTEEVPYAAKRILYGIGPRAGLSEDAQKLFSHPLLKGDDFRFLGEGADGFVISNGSIAVKISYRQNSEPNPAYALPNEIAPELAAEILPGGATECNGLRVLICEYLSRKRPPKLEEAISFLFRARDNGLIYTDPKPANLGHNSEGILKALDHDHFRKSGVSPEKRKASERKFAEILTNGVLLEFDSTKCPLAFTEGDNTYAVWSTRYQAPSEYEKGRKKICSILNSIGIDPEAAEFLDGVPVVRIPETRVLLGHPPQEESLAGYLSEHLSATAGRAETAAPWPERPMRTH